MYVYVCNYVMQENRVQDVPLTQMGVMDPQVANILRPKINKNT